MTTRWAILAPGRIAHAFAADLALVPEAELAAVGSRSLDRAKEFAKQYHVPAAYGSYQELVADPDVDVVYIASPHALHLEHARMAFEAGKHVLCEKPLALSVAEAEQMMALATTHDRFLMEAMWTACHPVVLELQRRLHEGEFGTPRHLHAELGSLVDADPADRLLDPALGASALLDMGVYPLTLAHLMLGEAESLVATAALSSGGIDLDVAIAGRYRGGALATMTASMTSWSSRRCEIATDRGRIAFDDFHHPAYATFTPYSGESGDSDDSDGGGNGNGGGPGAEPQRIEGAVPVLGRGFGHEILEVNQCLAEGRNQSRLVPHSQTLTLMRQMDQIREQLGITFSA